MSRTDSALPATVARPTMRQVAQRAGVSPATVSRALRRHPGVGPDLSAAVERAALELSFRPNLLGRNLRSQRSRSLGVVLPTLSHPVFAECLQALEQAARAAGQALIPVSTGYDRAGEDGAVELLLRQRVDGLVLTVADATRSAVLDKLEAERVPFVLVYNQLPPRLADAGRPTVSVDNAAAAAAMVERLLALGHRRVAMLAGPFAQSDRARLRHRGYLRAMRAARVAPMPVLRLPFLAEDAGGELQRAMRARHPPTALFCSNDHLAMVAILDLARMGLRVPQDVSVAGFDGVAVGALMSPALTTVEQPSARIAREALDLLLGRIEGRPAPPCTFLPYRLRDGGTAAAAHGVSMSALPPALHAPTR